jgi:hypothetical protein
MEKTECQKLAQRFEQLESKGLKDVKFFIADPSEAVVEQVCQEVNRLYEAVDRGECRPLKFNDSHGLINDNCRKQA